MKIKSTQKGFTLIELMIVVAIIGILASIAIPQFASFRVKAFNSASASDLKNAGTTIEAYYSDNFFYPNALNVPALATGPQTATFTNGTVTIDTNLSKAVELDLAVGTVTATKRCLATKHTSGNRIMTSNTDALSVTQGAEIAANIDKTLTASTIPACGI